MRANRSLVAVVLGLAVLAWGRGSYGGPDGEIESEGVATVKFRPQRLRLEARLMAQGKTVEEAIASLKEQRETLTKALEKLGAEAGDIRFGAPEQDELVQRGIRIMRALYHAVEENAEDGEGDENGMKIPPLFQLLGGLMTNVGGSQMPIATAYSRHAGDSQNNAPGPRDSAEPRLSSSVYPSRGDGPDGASLSDPGAPAMVSFGPTPSPQSEPIVSSRPTLPPRAAADGASVGTPMPKRDDVTRAAVYPPSYSAPLNVLPAGPATLASVPAPESPAEPPGSAAPAAVKPAPAGAPAGAVAPAQDDAADPKAEAKPKKDKKPKPPVPPAQPYFYVTCTVTAEWPLAAGDKTIELGAKVRESIEKMNITGIDKIINEVISADSAYLKFLDQYPDAKTVVNEVKHYFALKVMYVHNLTDADREEAVEQAFGRAKRQAELLAKASGSTLGAPTAMKVECAEQRDPTFWEWLSTLDTDNPPIKIESAGATNVKFNGLKSSSRLVLPPKELDLDSAQGAEPDSVELKLRVHATFKLVN